MDAPPFAQCTIEPYCGLTKSVGATESYRTGVRIETEAPAVNGTVFWELSLSPVDSQGAFYSKPAPQTLSWAGKKDTLGVAFKEDLPSYCVRLDAKDLTTGAVVSKQTCFPAGTPDSVAGSADICACQTPLPEILLPRWCDECSSPADPTCASVIADAGADAGGTSGIDSGFAKDSGTSGSGGASAAGGTPVDGSPATETAASTTGCGCSLPRRGESRGGLLLLAAAITGALMRRQRPQRAGPAKP